MTSHPFAHYGRSPDRRTSGVCEASAWRPFDEARCGSIWVHVSDTGRRRAQRLLDWFRFRG